MDDQNPVFGLSGMQSVNFVGELSHADEVTLASFRGGGNFVNDIPQDMAPGAVQTQQGIPHQASWGVNQFPICSTVLQNAAEYGQYDARNSGTLQNYHDTGQYGYSGMSGMHSLATASPRQAVSGSAAAWNHSPGRSGVLPDPLASHTYAGMPSRYSNMVPHHHGSVLPQQMHMSANQCNGMLGQMYDQYHDFSAAGTVPQQRVMAYSDSQNQMREMGLSSDRQQSLGSPRPTLRPSKLMPTSGQADQMQTHVHYQQPHQQSYPSVSAGMESSRYMTSPRPHHSGDEHVMSQYQCIPTTMQSQSRTPSMGCSQFNAQPSYRTPNYAATMQAPTQMVSPNVITQTSPQVRFSGSTGLADIRSPQPSQSLVHSMPQPGAITVESVPGSSPFQLTMPNRTAIYAVAANSTEHTGPQRKISRDSIEASPQVSNPPAQPPMPFSVPMGNTPQYAMPGCQMNACQNVPYMPGAGIQLYSGQQRQQKKKVEVPDWSYYFPQSHSQGYCQSAVTTSQPLDEASSNLANAIASAVNQSRLPIPVPKVFSGNPLEFVTFKKSFQTLIEGKGISSEEKIYHLQQYLCGEAKDAVEGCFYGTSAEDYNKAWTTLESRYGHPFKIQEAFRERLERWSKVEPKNGNAFQKYADFLRCCLDAMPHIRGLSILNDWKENQKLAKKLPDWAVVRWSRKVSDIMDDTGEYPTFAEFVTFVEKEAKIMCNPVISLAAMKVSESTQDLSQVPSKTT